MRLWDAATATPVGTRWKATPGRCTRLAAVPLPDGRVLVASASDDKTVRLWAPATGTPVGDPLEGHTGPVYAVAAVPLPDGPMLVASASDDHTIRLWDPACGVKIWAADPPLPGEPGCAGRCRAACTGEGSTRGGRGLVWEAVAAVVR